MRYVTYIVKTGKIVSASGGPPESHLNRLKEGESVGDVSNFQLKHAMQNYKFIPNQGEPIRDGIVIGTVVLKPKEDWDDEAENRYQQMEEVANQFHHLDINNVSRFKIYLIAPLRFGKLGAQEIYLLCNIDGLEIDVRITCKEEERFPFNFSIGKHYSKLPQTEISFELTGKETFIKDAIEDFKKKRKINEWDIFNKDIVATACFKFAIRLFNHLVEAYRVAFDDAEAHSIGVANTICCAIQTQLRSGHWQTYRYGNPYERYLTGQARDTIKPDDLEEQFKRMQFLLEKPAPPFVASAIASLKTAHLYGQYRECVVWGATIILSIIEDILLNNLDKNSSEYRKLKNDSANVRSKEKMKVYFKKITGKTIYEYLDDIINEFEIKIDDQYWNKLSCYLRDVLNKRNQLLHRKKAISSKEADEAFFTCMNFVYAISNIGPYSLYSSDYSLQLTKELI